MTIGLVQIVHKSNKRPAQREREFQQFPGKTMNYIKLPVERGTVDQEKILQTSNYSNSMKS